MSYYANLRIKICQLREAVQFNGLVCLTAYFSFVDAIFPARTGTFDIGEVVFYLIKY